ncbi:MAG TPA: hypothetical protein VND80_01165 [Steroidobacteraceae bacterium]|nr:hypothetical protein [Steroidobacteraceae bacterium]
MRFRKASAGLCLAATFAAGNGFAATGVPLPAVWKEHRVNFVYLGRTSRYSCGGLSDKVRAMLVDLGARRNLHITAIGCPEFGRPPGPNSLNPSLSIVFSAPALPAAAEKPRGPGDLAPVDARFEPFTIVPDAFRDMSVGDCELVEEFAQQILPLLTTRDMKKDITCVPYELSGSNYFLRGQILRALPRAEESALRRAPMPR